MTEQSTFQDLGLDSIAVVEVFVVLSEQLGVEVDDAQALPGTTLAQASELLSGVAPEVQ
ncbi:acyl carrier protein [Streptomyces sp. NPDC058872]|uniref:acyl carrier protein n=1 Tax=Streptomyces sp. NPDC058872 TaxID=3346661 RepID=UPI00368A19CA